MLLSRRPFVLEAGAPIGWRFGIFQCLKTYPSLADDCR